jgi:hypothetical protein
VKLWIQALKADACSKQQPLLAINYASATFLLVQSTAANFTSHKLLAEEKVWSFE